MELRSTPGNPERTLMTKAPLINLWYIKLIARLDVREVKEQNQEMMKREREGEEEEGEEKKWRRR